MKRLALVAGLTAVWVAAGLAALTAFDRVTPEANACGIAGPYDFDTYEAQNYVSDYGRMVELVTSRQAVASFWTLSAGDVIDLRLQGLESGPRGARLAPDANWNIPASVMKSIVWNETNYANAAPPGGAGVPYGGVGPVIRSFDCGYGLGQITSGMGNSSGTASGRQALIGTHPLFNLAEGVRILADKWNSSPEVRPVAGKGNPSALEDWYYAIWSYNGFAFSNHPLNPNRSIWRPEVYHCFSPEAFAENSSWTAFQRSHFTYPELVYGCMRYPPTRQGSLMWQPQVFNMPGPRNELQAHAFDIEHWGCISSGCPAMDFETDDPENGLIINPDNTPPDPLERTAAHFLGAPVLAVTGPAQATLTVAGDGSTATFTTVTVRNNGTYIAPFRIRTSSQWVVVRRAGDPVTRTLDGSVAIGTNVQVNVGTAANPVYQSGWNSVLTITVDPTLYPGGAQLGTVWIEPLYGGGPVYQLNLGIIQGSVAGPYRLSVPGSTSQ